LVFIAGISFASVVWVDDFESCQVYSGNPCPI
jgi:hypothetical protein